MCRGIGRRTELGGILQHSLAFVPLLYLRAFYQIAGDTHEVRIRGIERDIFLPERESAFDDIENGSGVLFAGNIEGKISEQPVGIYR